LEGDVFSIYRISHSSLRAWDGLPAQFEKNTVFRAGTSFAGQKQPDYPILYIGSRVGITGSRVSNPHFRSVCGWAGTFLSAMASTSSFPHAFYCDKVNYSPQLGESREKTKLGCA